MESGLRVVFPGVSTGGLELDPGRDRVPVWFCVCFHYVWESVGPSTTDEAVIVYWHIVRSGRLSSGAASCCSLSPKYDRRTKKGLTGSETSCKTEFFMVKGRQSFPGKKQNEGIDKLTFVM